MVSNSINSPYFKNLFFKIRAIVLSILGLFIFGFSSNPNSKIRIPNAIHAFHTSITQIEYNAKTKSYEVSARIFTDDLEIALDHFSQKKGTKIVNGDKNDALLASYLSQHLCIFSAQNKKINLKYIGKENEDMATWAYLEITDDPFTFGAKIQQNVLMERFDDQVNIVNFKKGETKKSFLFNIDNQVKRWE